MNNRIATAALSLLLALCLPCLAPGKAQPARQLCPIGATGYAVAVPDSWTLEERSLAAPICHLPDSESQLLVQAARFPQWTYDEYKDELTAASARSSVTDIAETTVNDRLWLTYRISLEACDVYCASTALEDGWFLTLEFRTAHGEADPFGDDVTRIMESLAKEDKASCVNGFAACLQHFC